VARVVFARPLQKYTQGAPSAVVAARTVRELFEALEARYPGIRAAIERGMAVAIDGDIISEPLLEPLEPESEVHFLPSIGGG
jgi:molybdopterin converting factor small subunit